MHQHRKLRHGLLAVALAMPSLAHAQAETVKVDVIPASEAADKVPAPGTSFFVDLMEAIATRAGFPV